MNFNNIKSYILLIAILLFPFASIAQKEGNKRDFRQVKKEMQEVYYDIEKYEAMKNKAQETQKSYDSLGKALKDLREEAQKSEQALQALKEEQERKQQELTVLERQLKQTPQSDVPNEGVFFSIQIGAYNKRDISHLIKENEAELNVEKTETGLKKYLIGGYSTYEDASQARLKLRRMGFKDAWIVAYKDGNRVDMTQVRDVPITEEELQELKKIK